MAQTSSIYSQPLSGNLGNQTFKNYGGKQVVATRFHTTSAKGDGASRAQRDTRMLMPNLTLIGSQLKDWLPALWENNKFYKRPYTHFISDNMKLELLVLPKSLIDLKRCVFGKLKVSCGTLPSISCTQSLDQGFFTNIKCPHVSNLNNYSYSDFSSFILNNNTGFADGDFLVFISVDYLESDIDSPYTTYYSQSSVSAIMLDTKGTGYVGNHFKGSALNLVSITPYSGDYRLGIARSWDKSFACVHVRKVRGAYLASTQFMSWNFYGAVDVDDMARQEYLDFCASSWGYKDKIL